MTYNLFKIETHSIHLFSTYILRYKRVEPHFWSFNTQWNQLIATYRLGFTLSNSRYFASAYERYCIMIHKYRFLKKQRHLPLQHEFNITKTSTGSFAIFFAILILGYLPKQSFAFSHYSTITNIMEKYPYISDRKINATQDTNIVFVQQSSSFFSVENISGKSGDTLPIKISLSPEITNS